MELHRLDHVGVDAQVPAAPGRSSR
jgi:hypothetical protein